MKKSLVNVITILILCAIFICAMVGCYENHTHKYGEWTVVQEPTCETDGLKVRSCSGCEEKEQATINAKGHTYGEWIAEVDATCIADGAKGHYKCSACQKYFDKDKNELPDIVIQKAHSLFFVAGKKATCTEAGYKDAYRCVFCREFFNEDGTALADKEIPATGHTYGNVIPEVPATEMQNGVKEHKDCLTCGLHFDAEGNELDSLVIPATVHNLTWVDGTPATCETDGEKPHYSCSHCSLVFDENYDVIDEVIIPAAHELKFSERLEPTCETDGHIALYSCENCSAIFDENKAETENYVLSALGHTYGEWVAEVPATCDTDGVKAHKTCSRCKKNFDSNDRETDVVIKASHSMNMVAEISATCTASGRQAYGQCSVCNKYFNVFGAEITDLDSLEIPAKNHSFEEWVNAIEAACADSGLLGHYHCRTCNKNFDKDGAEIANIYVAALGHLHTTEEIIPKKDATCIENGYVAHFECERCGAYTNEFDRIIKDAVIEKTGHISGMYTGRKVPTCTEPGVEGYYTCSKCGDRFLSDDFFVTVTDEDLVLQPIGHDYVYIKMEEPTCELEGRIAYYICDNPGCNWIFNTEKQEIKYTDLYIKPTGHDFGDWVEAKPATETEDGYIGHYQCKKCLYYFDEDKYQIGGTIVEPKTVHLFDQAWVEEVKATCTTNGTQGYYLCSHCNKKFDFNYKEIDDLTIPAHHNLSELTPASQAKCNDEDVLVAYYMCYDCYNYLDENMNILKYNDIFRVADRHDDVLSGTSNMYHFKQCRDCGREIAEMHQFEFEYVTDANNVPTRKGTCKVCDYVYTDTYYPVDRVYLRTDMYVGFHDSSMMNFIVKFRDGNEMSVNTYSVMSAADARRFEAIIDSSAEGFETRTESSSATTKNTRDGPQKSPPRIR